MIRTILALVGAYTVTKVVTGKKSPLKELFQWGSKQLGFNQNNHEKDVQGQDPEGQ